LLTNDHHYSLSLKDLEEYFDLNQFFQSWSH
jgi:hypothetical protein